jgi:hypothetical protein
LEQIHIVSNIRLLPNQLRRTAVSDILSLIALWCRSDKEGLAMRVVVQDGGAIFLEYDTYSAIAGEVEHALLGKNLAIGDPA